MAVSPIPSAEQITHLYQTGNLSAELAAYHASADDGTDTFLQRCVDLHNNCDIDLVSVPSQPAFSKIGIHQFFTAQGFYCDAIPKLRTNAVALMECCRILIERAGDDGAAYMPNGAFRQWCKGNPDSVADIIRDAKVGNELAKRFVTFALQGINDIETAIVFVRTYDDDRRPSGMAALGQMTYADHAAARRAIAVIEPFLAGKNDDAVRLNALSAAFSILQQQNDADAGRRLIEAVVDNPGPQTLHGLAQLLLRPHASLDVEATGMALNSLRAVDPAHLGTINLLDIGLRHMLGTPNEAQALEYLTEILRDGKLTIEHFQSTAQQLNADNPQRVYELVTRWLLSGSIALGNSTGQLVSADRERVFDPSLQSPELTPERQLLLCRKAIGFLFIHPVTCCSILVSVVRIADEKVRTDVAQLLFDPILLSYGGSAKDYLEGLPEADAAYETVRQVLARLKSFHSAIDAIGTIKELHPSDRQRNIAHQRSNDQMRESRKQAEKQSTILNLVHRSAILHGRSTLTYVADPGGQKRALAMDLHKHSSYIEFPTLEWLDPVGLDYLLRSFMAEKPS